MADSVNPYRSALAPYFPNKTKLEYKQDSNKVTHYFIYLNQEGPLGQWLKPDPSKTIQTNISQRVNAQVTDKKLHPLHLCAMLNREKMAKNLLETQVCQINPQDYLGFTPLHHAAVNNSQNMIALFIKYGANQNLTNSRQGTYLEVLNLVHPSIDPLKQTFHYKDPQTGKIIQGNGIDFQRYTGAETFLDKEPVVSVKEMVNEWNTNPIPEAEGSIAMAPVLQKAYQQFREHPPLVYLEKREDVGINVCAGEDIQSGTIVTEYLAEIKRDSESSTNTYSFEHFNGENKRGIGALINDGFPNCSTFLIANSRGIVGRIAICATTRIPKGGSIVYNYGPGHGIKYQCHQELNDEALSAFFKKYTNEAPNALIEDYVNQSELIKTMTEKNATASARDSFEKLVYLATTPHAILKLVCDQTLSIDALQPFNEAFSDYYADNPQQQHIMQLVHYAAQRFSHALKRMEPAKAQKCREKFLENLTKMDVNGLVNLLHSLSQT